MKTERALDNYRCPICGVMVDVLHAVDSLEQLWGLVLCFQCGVIHTSVHAIDLIADLGSVLRQGTMDQFMKDFSRKK